jgi:hypothetical protein
MRVHYLEKILFGILAVGLVAGVVFIWAEYPSIKNESNLEQQASVSTTTPTTISEPVKNAQDTIEVLVPQIKQVVSSPFLVTGKAKGMWFFEASFPIKILDQDGTLLGTGIATAQGNWMTEDFVDFKSIIEFTSPKGKTGNIIFMKDNPSGLPENDESFIIPITFSQAASAARPSGTCAPNLAACNNNPELCMEQNLSAVCG